MTCIMINVFSTFLHQCCTNCCTTDSANLTNHYILCLLFFRTTTYSGGEGGRLDPVGSPLLFIMTHRKISQKTWAELGDLLQAPIHWGRLLFTKVRKIHSSHSRSSGPVFIEILGRDTFALMRRHCLPSHIGLQPLFGKENLRAKYEY